MMYQPTCSITAIQQRARLYRLIRQFFAQKNVLEVETPIVSQAGATDVYLASIVATRHIHNKPSLGYLQTSPEFAMKRLLASGTGSIYQICKVFRDNEHGNRHNSEFTMLEWYQPSMSLAELMNETEELMTVCFEKTVSIRQLPYKIAFQDRLGINPLTADTALLKQTAIAQNISLDLDNDRLGYMDLLFSHCIEPYLGIDDPVFLTDFPKELASLAKTHQDSDGIEVASRFELYIDGLELANAYDELLDKNELLTRFEHDNQKRAQLGLANMPIDDRLLMALDTMPACAGIALGIDRLLMVIMNTKNIADVVTFAADNA